MLIFLLSRQIISMETTTAQDLPKDLLWNRSRTSTSAASSPCGQTFLNYVIISSPISEVRSRMNLKRIRDLRIEYSGDLSA
jgi:hypothetical protein